MALAYHRKMPCGRHGLRYLTVLSCLADRPDDAMQHATKLRRLEPDFSLPVLLNDHYPLSNTRDVQMMDRLRHKLV